MGNGDYGFECVSFPPASKRLDHVSDACLAVDVPLFQGAEGLAFVPVGADPRSPEFLIALLLLICGSPSCSLACPSSGSGNVGKPLSTAITGLGIHLLVEVAVGFNFSN